MLVYSTTWIDYIVVSEQNQIQKFAFYTSQSIWHSGKGKSTGLRENSHWLPVVMGDAAYKGAAQGCQGRTGWLHTCDRVIPLYAF